MRIVAGIYKGRRLRAPRGSGTRPTADRAREALFSILGPLDNLRVLDLYAGSGALAIEALSRGAASAVLVESDARALAAINANVEPLAADVRVERRDVVRYLRQAVQDPARFDLVLCDPPYSLAERLGEALSELIPGVTDENARIVTESDKRHPLCLDLPLELERTYGDARIAIHRVG